MCVGPHLEYKNYHLLFGGEGGVLYPQNMGGYFIPFR